MPEDRHDIVPAIEAAHVDSGLQLWWLGGPSYVVRSATTTVYVDPYHSGDRAGNPRGFIRAIPNYFLPEDVTRADVLVSTHNHSDHCDPATLEPLCRRTGARIAAAPSSARKMQDWEFTHGRVDVFPPGSAKTYGDITLRAYPSRDWDDPGAVTYVLSGQSRVLFVGGDTLYFDGLAAIARDWPRIDIAVLALAKNRRDIIDKELYLDPPMLAKAAVTLQARKALPVHWDIWTAWAEDPSLVEPHLQNTGVELVILEPGESIAV